MNVGCWRFTVLRTDGGNSTGVGAGAGAGVVGARVISVEPSAGP